MVNKVYNKKEIIILAIAIIVILVIIILNFKSEEKEAFIQTNNDLIQEDENKIEKVIIVHIVGCVKNPGIVEVKDGARIIDQTCPIMIQRLSTIFQRNPLISMGI